MKKQLWKLKRREYLRREKILIFWPTRICKDKSSFEVECFLKIFGQQLSDESPFCCGMDHFLKWKVFIEDCWEDFHLQSLNTMKEHLQFSIFKIFELNKLKQIAQSSKNSNSIKIQHSSFQHFQQIRKIFPIEK